MFFLEFSKRSAFWGRSWGPVGFAAAGPFFPYQAPLSYFFGCFLTSFRKNSFLLF
jgi:hypothetical protein